MKSSDNDIILTEGRTICYFSYLDWDTRFFGLPCYRLDVNDFSEKAESLKDRIIHQFKACFITVKIDTVVDYTLFLFLEKCGFNYIDTEVTLEHTGKNGQPSQNNCFKIDRLNENTGLPYEALGSIFSLTRFHADPHIPSVLADQLWIDYLQNYIPDKEHHMFVAKVQDEIVGVFLANETNQGAFLFYSAVIPGFQDKGIGAGLVRTLVNTLGNINISTGTQVKNVRALNFYIKNGFSKIKCTRTVMHRW